MVKDIFVMAILTHLDGVENAPSLKKFMDIKSLGAEQGVSRAAQMSIKTVSKKMAEFTVPSGQQ